MGRLVFTDSDSYREVGQRQVWRRCSGSNPMESLIAFRPRRALPYSADRRHPLNEVVDLLPVPGR